MPINKENFGTSQCTFVYLWSMVAFVLSEQSSVAGLKPYGPQSCICICTIQLFTEKFADPCNTCWSDSFRIENNLTLIVISSLGEFCIALGLSTHRTVLALCEQPLLTMTLESIYLPITWKRWKIGLEYRANCCKVSTWFCIHLPKEEIDEACKFRDRRQCQ